MSERIRLASLAGDSVTWNGVNQDEVRNLIGAAFAGVQYSTALVRLPDGRVIHVRQGDQIVRWDSGDVLVFTNDCYTVITEPERENA